MVELDGTFELDLALDGADEIDPRLRLLKGGGGALLREKIVASAARRFVVVAETPKKVERLGQHFRLPIEVTRFAWRDTRRRLARLLPEPELRRRQDGDSYLTDEGHLILDCAIPAGIDLDDLGPAIKRVPGVVEHGLFIGMAERALLGNPDGSVEVVEPPERSCRSQLRLGDREALRAPAVGRRAHQQADLAGEVLDGGEIYGLAHAHAQRGERGIGRGLLGAGGRELRAAGRA